MNDSFPYEVVPYSGVNLQPVGWCVTGPGVGGWQGIIPRTHDAMTKEHAIQLCDLLNRAFQLGQLERSRQIRQLVNALS